MPGNAVAAIACACVLLTPPGLRRLIGADGGSGTYFTQGRSAYFVLTNTGSAAWQSFYVVGPPGTTFVGGANTAEITARCVAGQPDGLPNEIECGPLSANVAPAHGQIAFAATLTAPVVCGATFQLAVSSTGTLPFTRAGAITDSGSCTTASPTAGHAAASSRHGRRGSRAPRDDPHLELAADARDVSLAALCRRRLCAHCERDRLDPPPQVTRRGSQRPLRRDGDVRRRHRRQPVGEARGPRPLARLQRKAARRLGRRAQAGTRPGLHVARRQLLAAARA